VRIPKLPTAWLGWQHSRWQLEWEKFRTGDGPLPLSTVVTAIDLETPLRRELHAGNDRAAEPLALWLAFHGRPAEALPLVLNGGATARRIAGMISWKALADPTTAVAHLEAGPLNDPIAVAELDELYAALGSDYQHRRMTLLACDSSHPRLIERRADLALRAGNPPVTIQLLSQTPWQREHQRYVRTQLWKAAHQALGISDAPVPDFLNEDNLARFGAYWSD
jgi:hypothetical protein